MLTYRLEINDLKKYQDFKKDYKNSYLYALWHQNLIAALFAESRNPHSMVVSASKDGELVAVACQLLGHTPMRGSSHRGGSTALKGMIRKLKNGLPGAITVDGPKGPAMEAKKGVFELALISGAPIIPLLPLSLNYWSFNSWDQFRLPKPFSKIIVWHGDPIFVSKEDKKDDYLKVSQELRNQLIEAEQKIKVRS